MASTMDLADAASPSIDAIVHATPEEMATDRLPTPSSALADSELPTKFKGRKRLLRSLQRMSSSPSLARMRSSSSSGYKSGGNASVSCISLASGVTPYSVSQSSAYDSESSPRFSTAPTSANGTPRPATPAGCVRPRVRTVGRDTPASVGLPAELRSTSAMGQCISVDEEDYFSLPVTKPKTPTFKRRANFNFWNDMPYELHIQILSHLEPKVVVRCSRISRAWHKTCFDGQLWRKLDTSLYYRDIPGDALVKVISSAGPFVRDLNLRGCVQLREKWNVKGMGLADACHNLENVSLEGCQIDRSSIHCFLYQNSRLVHINLSGLPGATNHAMRIIAEHCPKVEHLNVTWCCNVNTRGLRKVVEKCASLRDLRAGEVQGWDDTEFMFELFQRNTLERLLLTNCGTLTDESLSALLEGVDSEYDYLSGRVVVPPRKLKHLDLTHCRGVTELGIRKLAHTCPNMEGLQLSKCPGVTDLALCEILPTMPRLTHLDLEEIDDMSNQSLQTLASSPCHSSLVHLSISYCENLGDAGMLPVLKTCTTLSSLDMDNTKISDLVLTEAAAMLRTRTRRAGATGITASERPGVGLRLVAYDCSNVTWSGVREVLARNAEPVRTPGTSLITYPPQITQLKCFYNWQPTVEEHTKRVLRGDFVAARRLEQKWADYMIANEEASASGGGARRRRRRAREAQMMHADEEDGGMAGTGIGRRRRARSGPGGCVIM